MATTAEIQDQVIEAYIATFNRAADADGLNYWVANITSNGWNIQDVAKSFFDSVEVAQTYPPTMSDTDFLNKVYNNVLGRDGDTEGIAYWEAQMQNGLPRNEMIMTIVNGAKAASGDPQDKLFLDNKKNVAKHFVVDLGLNDTALAVSALSSVTTLPASVDEAKDKLDAYSDALNTAVSLIQGDDTDNTLNGDANANHIYAWAGNDVIMSGDGDNVIVAGSGIDSIYAGSGNDTIKGRQGDDTVYADAGDDLIYGNEGNDSLHGQDGADIIYGNADDDYIYGEAGNDVIYGGDGVDVISGGDGDDVINGDAGNDIINADEGSNVVDGGAGDDLIYGGSVVDRIYGGSGNDTIYGLAGNDNLDGLVGNDTVYAGDGDDVVNGNEGNDVLYGSAGSDKLDAEDGDDTLNGGIGADTLSGGTGVDTFVFNTGESDLASLDIITDFSYAVDKIILSDHGTEVISASKSNVDAAASLSAAADLVSSADASTNAQVKWFVYNDNTYIVEDLSAAATFQNGADIIIKLQGILDLQGLDTSTLSFV